MTRNSGDPNLLTAKTCPVVPIEVPTGVLLVDLLLCIGARAFTIHTYIADLCDEYCGKQRRPHGAAAFHPVTSTPASPS